MKAPSKRKPVTLRQEATRLGTAILTRQEARRRAAMAIRRVCGVEIVEGQEHARFPQLSFEITPNRHWRFGRR